MYTLHKSKQKKICIQRTNPQKHLALPPLPRAHTMLAPSLLIINQSYLLCRWHLSETCLLSVREAPLNGG